MYKDSDKIMKIVDKGIRRIRQEIETNDLVALKQEEQLIVAKANE